ncbi:splicing factor 3B subunit 4-like [Brassica napus]|uniref:splicing factor 3B subunit 4-like n=1 Tax=Brassica napus TaxID=3708 RepID=UPI00207891D7|nr:splicing factor 3B subunit 4-like [Brassica napus]
MKDNRRKRDRHSRRKAATEERRRMKAVKDKEKAIDDGEEDREKRSLMESGTKLRPGYMVINNGMIHYQSKPIKVFNMIKLHGKSIRVNKDTKSLDVGANLFIGNLDHASICLGGNVLHFRSCKDRDTMNSRGFGFISYGSYDASHAATEGMAG